MIFVVNSAIKSSNLKIIHSSNKFNFMIADECHHYGSNLFANIFENKFEFVLGLSATPERENDPKGTGKIIEGIGPKIFELNHLDDPNAIPPFVIWNILVSLTEIEKQQYEENSLQIIKLNGYFLSELGISSDDQEYREKIQELAKKNNPAALKLLSLWSKQSGIKYQAENKINLVKEIVNLEKDSKIIIFNERIKFTERLYNELNKEPDLNLFLIHSQLSKYQVILNNFKDAEKGILVVPKLIDEGYDVPDASVAIIVSFTSSARQMIQRDGRILRKTDEQKKSTRYSLVIEDIEEKKYFEVLQKSNMASKAMEGEWVRYDTKDNTFSNAEHFKEDFINFGKIKEYYKDQDKEWFIKRLDYYEVHFNRKIDDIKHRVDFFSRFINVIDSLSVQYPDRWPILKQKLKNVSRGVKFKHALAHIERDLLKKELRNINSRVILSPNVFNAISRFIDNEEFVLDAKTKVFLENLVDGEKPLIWPDDLYHFLKEIMLKEISA